MITPRKGLFVVALVLLCCGLLHARWTRWLTRPVAGVVETVQWPAGWIASNFKTNPPAGSSYESDDPLADQIEDLKERLEVSLAWNKQLWQENEQLREQIESYEAINLIRPIEEIRPVEARVARFSDDAVNPTMKLLRGSLHGLKQGDAVVYKADLLGFITAEIGPANAVASLITRPGFEIQVNIMPPKEEDAAQPGWPLVDRVKSDGKGAFTCDLRLEIAEALRPGDLVRVADDLRHSANGFVLGVVSRIDKHPNQPKLLRRVYIQPRTAIGPQRLVTVLTDRSD